MFFIGLVVSHDQFIDLENVNICYIRGHFAQLGGPFFKAVLSGITLIYFRIFKYFIYCGLKMQRNMIVR